MRVIGASNLTPKSQVSIKWGKYVTSVTGQHYPLLKKVLLAHRGLAFSCSFSQTISLPVTSILDAPAKSPFTINIFYKHKDKALSETTFCKLSVAC